MELDKAEYFEKMCNLMQQPKPKRLKGDKVGNGLDRDTSINLNMISKFFGIIREQFFHISYPKSGTILKDVEKHFPEIDPQTSHAQLIVKVISENLHRLVFDDRDSIMDKVLLTRERKFFCDLSLWICIFRFIFCRFVCAALEKYNIQGTKSALCKKTGDEKQAKRKTDKISVYDEQFKKHDSQQ